MIRRREFITLLGGAAVARPRAARAQQPALPVIGFVSGNAADAVGREIGAFRRGLNESGIVEGLNATVEYHWMEGHFDRAPAVMADLVRRKVAVIATPGTLPSRAAKAATSTIPIVFGVGGDPVQLGLVASLARPGGTATGINFFREEVVAKRLRLLHDLVPSAVRIAVLVNPANPPSAEPTSREARQAAPAIGLQVHILNASRSARSMRPSQPSGASALMPCSSLRTASTTTMPRILPVLRRATRFPRPMTPLTSSKLAG